MASFTEVADFILDDLFGFSSANAVKDNTIYLRDNLITAGLPAGIKAIFFQASAPNGWTKDTSNNDRFLRVVSGSGGGTGGSWSLATAGSHSHSLVNSGIFSGSTGTGTAVRTDTAGGNVLVHSPSGGTDSFPQTTSNTDSQGLHAHTHDSSHHQYIDVLVCTKDAYP